MSALSQPKREVAAHVDVINSQATPSQLKRERPPSVLGAVAVKQEQQEEEAKPHIAPEPPLPQPAQHPTGVWLSALAQSPRQQPSAESVVVDGVSIPRAAWSPGAGLVPERGGPARPVAASVPSAGPAPPSSGRAGGARRNFKAFSKTRRHVAIPREAVVPVVPWKNPFKASMSELFGSQALESESQGPPQYL